MLTSLFFQNCSQTSLQTSGSQNLGSSSDNSGSSQNPPVDNSPPAAPISICSQGQTYYISPNGSDANLGNSEASPFKTFNKAFMSMKANDQLYLLDGTYSVAAGTGVYSYLGNGSNQAPSGTSSTQYTCVRAKNPGKVQVLGGLFVGRSNRKDQYIYIEGITFTSSNDGLEAGTLFNTDHVYIKNCGFHGLTEGAGSVFGIGTNDGDWGNTNDLAEDIWVWGHERVGLIVYRSDHIVIRRAVVRNDGCDSHNYECGNNNGNSMVGITTYNSHHVAMENVLVVDNLLGPGGYDGASDIQTAWHDNFVYPFGANQWFGVVSINSEYSGMYPEVDGPIAGKMYQPLYAYKDIVVAGSKGGGVSAQAKENMTGTSITMENISIVNINNAADDAFRVGPEYSNVSSSYVRNILVSANTRYAMNSAITPSYVDLYGNFTDGLYNQTNCTTGCLTTNPKADGATPSLKYLTRIENGSKLKAAGFQGSDIGANVINRYGVDGTYFDQANYSTLTGTSLWPWPNQARIQNEMCAQSSVSRGFCAKKNISYYVWEYLGNTCPSGLCE